MIAYIDPTDTAFGAIGDGVADDTSAIQFVVADGRPVHWGGPTRKYRITDTIRAELKTALIWRSDGAEFLFDAPTSRREAFAILTAGHRVVVDGPLHLNAGMKAFIGFLFENLTNYAADIDLHRLSIENIYRASTAFTGGDGCWIRGSWRNVYVERFSAHNMVMAAGTGQQAVCGIFGLSISRNGSGYPQSVRVTHPHIDNVYCEDADYRFDQDGLRVMTFDPASKTVLPDEGSLFVDGGTFRNCRGRSIKSQCDATTVVGAKFIRSLANSTGVGNPEIDIQVGGGNVSGIDFTYSNSVPDCLVFFSGSYVSGKRMTGGNVRGVNGQVSGSVVLPDLFVASSKEGFLHTVNITDVQTYTDGQIGRIMTFNPAGQCYLNLTNISTGVESAGIRLLSGGSLTTTFRGVRNYRAARPLLAGHVANIDVQERDLATTGWS